MIIESQFKAATGLSSPHLQTLLPTYLRANFSVEVQIETLQLDDEDFLDLAWSKKPEQGQAIVILFHGLEGSINSPYAKGMMQAIKNQGWVALLMHFRGCSGRPNNLPRSYHSGETEDAKSLLNYLNKEYPKSRLAAVGFSLGGNMLLKLQAELAGLSPLNAAVSVCAPLLLADCTKRLGQGFSRFYQRHLIKRMIQKLKYKTRHHDLNKLINLDELDIEKLDDFWQFDDRVTAPLHGFNGVDDYYNQCSAKQYLKEIVKPCLIIQARDDPFMTKEVLPMNDELSENTILEISEKGGHVGYISGTLFNPVFWLEQRIPEYLKQYI